MLSAHPATQGSKRKSLAAMASAVAVVLTLGVTPAAVALESLGGGDCLGVC
jgi:hypothetical protein